MPIAPNTLLPLAALTMLLAGAAGVALARAIVSRGSRGHEVHGAAMTALTLTLVSGTGFGAGVATTWAMGTADPGTGMYLLGASGVLTGAWAAVLAWNARSGEGHKAPEGTGTALSRLVYSWSIGATVVGGLAGVGAVAVATAATMETAASHLASAVLGALALAVGIGASTGNGLVRAIIGLYRNE